MNTINSHTRILEIRFRLNEEPPHAKVADDGGEYTILSSESEHMTKALENSFKFKSVDFHVALKNTSGLPFHSARIPKEDNFLFELSRWLIGSFGFICTIYEIPNPHYNEKDLLTWSKMDDTIDMLAHIFPENTEYTKVLESSTIVVKHKLEYDESRRLLEEYDNIGFRYSDIVVVLSP